MWVVQCRQSVSLWERQYGGGDTIILPEQSPNHWCNIFTGEVISIVKGADIPLPGDRVLLLADVFRNFPVALLMG
jgi:maltooligosyltrehalose synthase